MGNDHETGSSVSAQNNGGGGGPSPENENQQRMDEKQLRELEERVEKQEDKILKLESSVFQLANYYFVFQGVILTAIVKGSSSSSFECKNVWLPLLLSLIGAVLNFGTLLIISKRYNEYLNELDRKTGNWYRAAYPNASDRDRLLEEHRKQKKWRKIALVSSMVLFFIFVVANLVGIVIILC